MRSPLHEALGRMKGRKMNKTEAAYNRYLEVKKQIGEVLWFEYEPMSLRLADKCFYKVDFLVLTKEFVLEVHEIKGGFMTDDSLVKFKTAFVYYFIFFHVFYLSVLKIQTIIIKAIIAIPINSQMPKGVIDSKVILTSFKVA